MPSKDPAAYLLDIETSIDRIEEFIGTMNLGDYLQDIKTRRSVEREFQIFTEAAFRLQDDAERLCPGINWRGIRGFGNFLRHSYDDVNDVLVWNSVKEELPALRLAVIEAQRALASGQTQ